MDDAFGMDDDLKPYSDAKLYEALRRATSAQELAVRQLSQAADLIDNTNLHNNLTETVQTLTAYIGRINAEMTRRGIS
jgi:hypothetical protein